MRMKEKRINERMEKGENMRRGKNGEVMMKEKEKKSGTREWKREGKERECMGKKSVSRQVERGGKIRRQGGGQGENNEDRQVVRDKRTRRRLRGK